MRGASSRAQCVHDTTPRCSRQALRASNNKEHTRYDDNGNTLTKTRISDSQKHEFSWDYRNRLTQVLLKNSSGAILQQTDYTYDAFDRRIIKVHDPNGPGAQQATTTNTIYDGASFAANPYADFDGSHTLTMRYLYGPVVDMILGRRDAAGTVAWHLSDHIGTVRDVTSSSGAVLDHISYSSFGKVVAESSQPNGDRFKFTGRDYDPETSALFYRARHFDPGTGRFLRSDPIGYSSNDSNLYRYGWNAPTVFRDPRGLAPIQDLAAGSVSIPFPGNPPAPLIPPWVKALGAAFTEFCAGVATRCLPYAAFGAGMAPTTMGDAEPPWYWGRSLDDIMGNEKDWHRWLKHKHDKARPLSPEDAQKVWEKLVRDGYTPRVDQEPKRGTWPPHINVEGKSWHIPIPPGWEPAPVPEPAEVPPKPDLPTPPSPETPK